MNASVGRLVRERHVLSRMRVQLFGGLCFAIFLPAFIRLAVFPGIIYAPSTQATIAAACVAHLLGFLAYRRMGNFPGIASAGHILPVFAIAYGVVFLAIFFLRIDYSRYQAASSCILSVVWYFGLSVILRDRESYRLAVVPGGGVGALTRIGGVLWLPLRSWAEPVPDVHGVVADLRAGLEEGWQRYIADCALAGVPVYHVKQIGESLTGRLEIEYLSENTLGSLNPNMAYLKIKQVADWLAAGAVLVIGAPVLLLIALAIRLDSPGPALFIQDRVGYRGRVFKVYKFRSMHVEEAGSDRESAMTRSGDARITRLGRLLRRFRLDEVPQAINVLRGEMSWIGPRPEAVVLSRWYEAELPFYRYRHIVRPGITGWAQVNQGHVVDVGEVLGKLHYDFYYIKNFSPWLDLVIVLSTFRTMLTGYGAR